MGLNQSFGSSAVLIVGFIAFRVEAASCFCA
jgi:hypothetical protein